MQKLLFDLIYNSFIATALLLFIGQSSALGVQSCNDYPERVGRKIVDTPLGLKILSTAQVSVPFDDVDLYIDAIDEATMEAKAAISSYLSEQISKDCVTNIEKKIVQDDMKMKLSAQVEPSLDMNGENNIENDQRIRFAGEGKMVDIQKIKNTLCSLTSSTSALLRNVDIISSCYNQGRFVLVTVGIKPSVFFKLSDE